MIKNTLSLLFACCALWFNPARAQLSPVQTQSAVMALQGAWLSANSDSARLQSAAQAQQLLLQGLASKEAWVFEFDSLRMSTIAIASDPKSSLRLFTWNAVLLDKRFVHFGIIQCKKGSEIQCIPLYDSAQDLPEAWDEAELSADEWIGALYYQLIPLGKKQYMLLGFDGHNQNSNRSIVDVLHLEQNEEGLQAIFGKALFRESLQDPSRAARMVFEYHKSARMLLRYEPSEDWLVVDNLGATFDGGRDNPFVQIPTGDYSAYKEFKGGSWVRFDLETLKFVNDKEVERSAEPLTPSDF
ncbi:MAG: hypothetical protein ACO3DK_01695 [Bacteroidia bacterium]